MEASSQDRDSGEEPGHQDGQEQPGVAGETSADGESRRSFLKGGGLLALATAAGYVTPTVSSAQSSSSLSAGFLGPPEVGFVYDPDDVVGARGVPGAGAEVFWLFDQRNASLIHACDVITCYRGIQIGTGAALSAAIVSLGELNFGDHVSMAVKLGGVGSPVVISPVARQCLSGKELSQCTNAHCVPRNSGDSCHCEPGNHNCTLTREWRTNPSVPKKWQYRRSCDDQNGHTCGPGKWYDAK
jgi:hypothetical protein